MIFSTSLRTGMMLRSGESDAPTDLTRDQRTVRDLIAQGHGTAAIARRVGYDRAAVRRHLADALRALGAASVAAAVNQVTSLGLIDFPDSR